MEDTFGAPLIVRSARGVMPTPEGEVVLAWAQEILHRTKEVRQQIEDMAGAASRTVTIGLTPSLVPLIAGMLAQNADRELPRLGLRFIEDFSANIASSVEEARIDIGLCYDPRPASLVHCTPILRERLCYISSPGSDGGPITLEEVLQRPLALPVGSDSIRKKLEAAAHTINHPVICKYELGSLQAAIELAMRGLAGAVLPFGGVEHYQRSSDLSVRMVVSPMIERTLCLLRLADRVPGAMEQKLVEFIHSILKSVVEESEDLEFYILIPPGTS